MKRKINQRTSARIAEKIIKARTKGRPCTVQNAIIAALYTDPTAVKPMIAKCFTQHDLAVFRNDRYKRYSYSSSPSWMIPTHAHL